MPEIHAQKGSLETSEIKRHSQGVTTPNIAAEEEEKVGRATGGVRALPENKGGPKSKGRGNLP